MRANTYRGDMQKLSNEGSHRMVGDGYAAETFTPRED
jgi:hypothetical protein